MKIYTTNYKNTFIEVAEDCPIKTGEIPPVRGSKKSIGNLQFERLIENPYKFTSDEILFHVFATKSGLLDKDMENERKNFFSKGQPCFRASPLAKRYGWGIYYNQNGKIAIYGVETEKYQNFCEDNSVKKLKAMRTKQI